VSSLWRYNGLNSLERLTAEVKTAGCLPHKIENELPPIHAYADMRRADERNSRRRTADLDLLSGGVEVEPY